MSALLPISVDILAVSLDMRDRPYVVRWGHGQGWGAESEEAALAEVQRKLAYLLHAYPHGICIQISQRCLTCIRNAGIKPGTMRKKCPDCWGKPGGACGRIETYGFVILGKGVSLDGRK